MMERCCRRRRSSSGVDEHTAVVLDLDARTATVVGNGTMTIRRDGHSIVHPTGDVVPFDAMTSGIADAPLAQPLPTTRCRRRDSRRATRTVRCASDSDRLDARSPPRSPPATSTPAWRRCSELEQVLPDWSADTKVSDDSDMRGRSCGRWSCGSAISVAPTHAAGSAIEPLMDVLLAMRRRPATRRTSRRPTQIRDGSAGIDIEIRDTPDGATWHRRDDAVDRGTLRRPGSDQLPRSTGQVPAARCQRSEQRDGDPCSLGTAIGVWPGCSRRPRKDVRRERSAPVGPFSEQIDLARARRPGCR